MKHLKLYESFSEIESICQKYRITNYTINDDGSIDVDGHVDLDNKRLTKIPLQFRNVSGSFYCSDNQLTSLEGCPKSVGGGFSCSDNQLTSLEGGPKSVGGGFNCSYNQLTTLEGCPKSVGGDFYCDNNPIYNIWILFQDLDKIDLFNDFDIIRGNTVILDRLNMFLEEIGKRTVKKVDGYKCI